MAESIKITFAYSILTTAVLVALFVGRTAWKVDSYEKRISSLEERLAKIEFNSIQCKFKIQTIESKLDQIKPSKGG